MGENGSPLLLRTGGRGSQQRYFPLFPFFRWAVSNAAGFEWEDSRTGGEGGTCGGGGMDTDTPFLA